MSPNWKNKSIHSARKVYKINIKIREENPGSFSLNYI
jgi:hypothetical protein